MNILVVHLLKSIYKSVFEGSFTLYWHILFLFYRNYGYCHFAYKDNWFLRENTTTGLFFFCVNETKLCNWLAFCGEQNQDNVVFLPYGFLSRTRISFFSQKCQSIIPGASACISPWTQGLYGNDTFLNNLQKSIIKVSQKCHCMEIISYICSANAIRYRYRIFTV